MEEAEDTAAGTTRTSAEVAAAVVVGGDTAPAPAAPADPVPAVVTGASCSPQGLKTVKCDP